MSKRLGQIALVLTLALAILVGCMRITAVRGPQIRIGSAMDEETVLNERNAAIAELNQALAERNLESFLSGALGRTEETDENYDPEFEELRYVERNEQESGSSYALEAAPEGIFLGTQASQDSNIIVSDTQAVGQTTDQIVSTDAPGDMLQDSSPSDVPAVAPSDGAVSGQSEYTSPMELTSWQSETTGNNDYTAPATDMISEGDNQTAPNIQDYDSVPADASQSGFEKDMPGLQISNGEVTSTGTVVTAPAAPEKTAPESLTNIDGYLTGVLATADVTTLSNIPETARLEVVPITGTTAEYFLKVLNDKAAAQGLNIGGENGSGFVFTRDNTLVYDIGIYDAAGNEIEPQNGEQVKVALDFTDNQLAGDLNIRNKQDLAVVHLANADLTSLYNGTYTSSDAGTAEIVTASNVKITENAVDKVSISLGSMSPVFFVNRGSSTSTSSNGTAKLTVKLRFVFDAGMDTETVQAEKSRNSRVVITKAGAVVQTLDTSQASGSSETTYTSADGSSISGGSDRQASEDQTVNGGIRSGGTTEKISAPDMSTLSGNLQTASSTDATQSTGTTSTGSTAQTTGTTGTSNTTGTSSNTSQTQTTTDTGTPTGSMQGQLNEWTFNVNDLEKGEQYSLYFTNTNTLSGYERVIKYGDSFSSMDTAQPSFTMTGDRTIYVSCSYKKTTSESTNATIELHAYTKYANGNMYGGDFGFLLRPYTLDFDGDKLSDTMVELEDTIVKRTSSDGTWKLYRRNGAPNDSGTSTVTFPIEFREDDLGNSSRKTFYFRISEENEGDMDISYDKTVYAVQVVVTNSSSSGLTAKVTGVLQLACEGSDKYTRAGVYYTDEGTNSGIIHYGVSKPESYVVFNNAYGAIITLEGTMTLKNEGSESIKIASGDYEFLLGAYKEKDGDPAYDLLEAHADGNKKNRIIVKNTDTVDKIESGKTGEVSFKFPTLNFSKEGEYVFRIEQKDTEKANVVYDEKEYDKVIIEVTKDGNGLTAKLKKVKKDGDDQDNFTVKSFKFANTYKIQPVTLKIGGTKSFDVTTTVQVPVNTAAATTGAGVAGTTGDANATAAGATGDPNATAATAATTTAVATTATTTVTTNTTTAPTTTASFTIYCVQKSGTGSIPGTTSTTTTSSSSTTSSTTTAVSNMSVVAKGGSYTFEKALTYTKTGTYVYEISENRPSTTTTTTSSTTSTTTSTTGYTNSKRVYTLTVEVTNDKKGVLKINKIKITNNETRDVVEKNSENETIENYMSFDFVNKYVSANTTASTVAGRSTTTGTSAATGTAARTGTAAGASGDSTASASSGSSTAAKSTTASRSSSSSTSQRSSSSSSGNTMVNSAIASLKKVVPSVLGSRRTIATGDQDLTDNWIVLAVALGVGILSTFILFGARRRDGKGK